jgi:hypothetical protein
MGANTIKELKMKKMLLGLLVLVGFQTANATSIMGTTLDFSKVVKSNGRTSHQLSVYVDGTVVDRDFGTLGLRIRPQHKVVTRLTGDQMDRINRLVRRASPEINRFQISGARCFAPAFAIGKYTANNFSVGLRSGDVCDGGWTVNVRPAAKKLVNVLEVLERAAHARTSFAQIDSEIEAALN